VLTGAIAAALTPLRDGGASLDEAVVAAYADFLAGGGLDGILALGTTGEGILLSVGERKRVAELFLQGALPVAVHCGAQTTADTCALAAHAADAGAAAVAVIGPPYFALDDLALLVHFEATARACEPLPFYLYEFRARAGYSIAPSVIDRLRERAPNLVGMKVSNRPFSAVEPYLIGGLDIFVGAEELAVEGFARGAAGVVSGLAAVFPEEMARLVRERTPGRAGELRAGLDRFPFHAAAKHAVARRGVPMREDVRGPLRTLTDEERRELDVWLDASS
jgi:dihydrodipicolinate synthase/N-acetylneuraminate lyase